ncbi:SH3 domain-containing protein [Streptomyces sp. NPDC053755]|uniref:SH3 domain-containing protein n=1 Tax=Streptomyces sp. NPDC053755 TaxID=3155815 RepID=UPI003412EF9E
MKRRFAAVIPAVAMAALAIPMVTAAPATAHAACGTGAADADGGAWNANRANGANMRSGSSTGCGINGIAYSSSKLDYHCYTVGNDGYSWTYVRNDSASPDTFGWIRDDLLSDGGSYVAC